MRSRLRRPTLATLLVLAVATGWAVAAPAGARTYFVSGQQIPAADGSTATMRGGLIGTWTSTSVPVFEQPVGELPLLVRVTGAERFDGCLNRHRDWSCRHDPKGSLTFYNDTWGQYAEPAPEVFEGVWGACVHPITSGTGAFAGAQGVITMIDTFAPGGVYLNTRYDGNIVLSDQSDAAAPPQALSGPSTPSDAAPPARAAGSPPSGCAAR
jgi:hypothetical protein